MPVQRFPQRHPSTGMWRSALLSLLLLPTAIGGSLLRAQVDPNPPAPHPSPFERYEHFFQGEYFRAWDEPASVERSWSSYERLIRSESAIYAGLEYAALHELDLLLEESVQSEYRARGALRKGLIELKRGEHVAARLTLNNAVDRETDDRARRMIAGEALFWIGASHLMESGRSAYGQAREIFEECASEHPTSPRADDALYYIGQIAEAEEEYEDALAHYRRLLDTYPQSDYRIAASVRRIQLQNRLRRFDDAFRELDQLETLWSWYVKGGSGGSQRFAEEVDLELVLLRGDISIGRGDLSGAERAWLTLLYKFDGGYQRVGMIGLAETYRVAGMIDSALSLYDRLIIDGDDRIARQAEFFRALALATGPGRGESDRERGNGELKDIYGDDLHPMRENAALALADICYRSGEYREAVEYTGSVLASGEDRRLRARAGLIGGAALIRLDRPTEGVSLLVSLRSDVASVPPREMPEAERVLETALRLEGIGRLRSGDPDGAIAAFGRYLKSARDSVRFPEVVRMQAEAEMLAGRREDGVARLEELVATWPTSDLVEEALYRIGWSHFRNGDLKRAEGAFARLVKAWPLSRYAAESQLRRGDCFYLNRQFTQAAALYGEVTSLNPTQEEGEYAAYQGGMASWLGGDSVAARSGFELFAADYPTSDYADDALFMSGLIDFRAGDYLSAVNVMRRLLDTWEESRLQARAYYTIADAYYRLGRFDEAVAAYSIVTERYPESTYMADAEAGIVYARAAKEKVSDQARLGAVQVSDVSGRPAWEIELRRAEIFLEASRFEEAEFEYRNFIDTYPESENLPAAWLGLAQVELARFDTAAAIDTLSSMLQRFSGGHVLPMAALRLADLQVGLGDTAAAVMTLAQVRERFPESAALAVALIREAELLGLTGDQQKAIEVLRYGAGRLDTVTGVRTRSGGVILAELARLEVEQGEIESARERWNLLGVRGDSLGAEALIQLAGSLQNEGRIDEARRTWERADSIHGEDPLFAPRISLGRGRALELAGEAEAAEEIYRDIITRRKDDHFAVEAKNRLEEMNR